METAKARRLAGLSVGLLCLSCGQAPESGTSTQATVGGTARRFDLICRGRTGVHGRLEPFVEVLHVDLDSGRYCRGRCEIAEALHSQTADLIVFRDRPSDGYFLVDRASWAPSSGRYVAEFTATFRMYHESKTEGSCVRSSYTGSMPEQP
jgi:hypothetical protein